MLVALWLSWFGWLKMALSLLLAVPAAGLRHAPKRLLLFVVGWLLFGLLNALHWLGFALDEIFFHKYRRVQVDRPLFVLGVPRSGTTHLQRVLANVPEFTSLTLVDAVLAPSISERYFWFGCGRLVKRLFARLNLAQTSSWFSVMDDIHRIRLDEPEEDFLLLLWVQACFLLVVPCPDNHGYWNLGRFDNQLSDASRQRIMSFYRRCLQKQLYFHGEHLRILSKNPSFTPMQASLRQAFPDGVFVACVREPGKTVPSQLSSLLPAFALIGDGDISIRFRQRMLSVLHHYYRLIRAHADELLVVPMWQLNEDLPATVKAVLQRAGVVFSDADLGTLTQPSGSHTSQHQYQLADFHLDAAELEKQFEDVWPLHQPSDQLSHQPFPQEYKR